MVFLMVILFFAFLNSLAPIFLLNRGYSAFWLIILYCLGAIIKKCEIGGGLNARNLVGGVVVLNIISWWWKLFGLEFTVGSIVVDRDFFVSYTSPTMVLTAVLYLIFFSRLILSSRAKQMLAKVSPSVFSVYIINDHRLFSKHIMNQRFAFLADGHPLKLMVVVLAFSITFVVFSLLVDQARIKAFRLLKIDRWAKAIENKVNETML